MSSKQQTIDYLLGNGCIAGSLHASSSENMAFITGTRWWQWSRRRSALCEAIAAGKTFLGDPEYAPPYPGAKDHFLIPEDEWEDSERLCELIRLIEPEIKPPAKRKKNK